MQKTEKPVSKDGHLFEGESKESGIVDWDFGTAGVEILEDQLLFNVNEIIRELRLSVMSFPASHVQLQSKFPLSVHLITFVIQFVDS